MKFYEQLPKLFPHSPGLKQRFESNPELVEATAKRNSSLQGAYLIMAARALGLDCGPMSGFDQAKAGNIKRVTSAVGEGSIAIAFVHQVLQRT